MKIKVNKKTILIAIIIVVLVFSIYQLFVKEEKLEFVLEKVTKGTVLKEVSETGTVKISEEANFGFKNAGRIKKIYVEVGDIIGAGQELAKLDTTGLFIELTEAQAALEVAEAKKTDAQVSLENARQSLKDIEADAKEDLKQAYEDALNILDDFYLKIYNAFNTVGEIQRSYFTSSDQEGIKVRDNKDKIERALNQAESYVDDAKADSPAPEERGSLSEAEWQNEKIDTALSEIKEALEDTRDALEIIRDMTEEPLYRNSVSSSDKTSLDNQKLYIITALTDIVDAQQTISTTKITNETNINSAKAEISSLETQLQENGLYQAQVNQAKAKVSLLENKIQETVLRSPGAGQITKVNKKEGETVTSSDSVISLLPGGPFQVEVDIYEEDIVNVKIGNSVEITLAAFPDEPLIGRVISIDPAEKLIEGVVYYEVNISFESKKEGVKPGMTADIIIEANRKEDVLVIPKGAVKKINSKRIVQVHKDGQIETKEIEIGLEGNELLEVISGLEEGEEVVID